MLGKELLSYVDHTLLRPTATWDDIKEICDAGVAYKTASVCIPPDFVASAHESYPGLNVCTVIGFPLGSRIIFVIFEMMKAMVVVHYQSYWVVNVPSV